MRTTHSSVIPKQAAITTDVNVMCFMCKVFCVMQKFVHHLLHENYHKGHALNK